jgi:predicted HicB family RNase H-like nuclease
MMYKGYIGNIIYDENNKIFHGDIINTRDVITFQGHSVEELEKAFHDSIDDYISWCNDEGLSPEKPYSGKFNLRISPELHRKIAIEAKKNHLSLNKYVEKALIDEINLHQLN